MTSTCMQGRSKKQGYERDLLCTPSSCLEAVCKTRTKKGRIDAIQVSTLENRRRSPARSGAKSERVKWG